MKVLALSSSRVGNSSFLEAAISPIRQLLGTTPRQLAFLPFAAVERDYEAYGEMVRQALHSLGHAVHIVTPENGTGLLSRVDAVLVGGGNTFKLLHDVYAHALFDTVRTMVLNGMPYIGWSAGANLCGRSICTTNDMPIIQPLSFDAFDFLPFQINPHYINQKLEGHNGETRDQRLSEFVHLNPDIPVIGLPEGTFLYLEEDTLTFQGIMPGVMFEGKQGNPMQKSGIAPGADLSFLLSRFYPGNKLNDQGPG